MSAAFVCGGPRLPETFEEFAADLLEALQGVPGTIRASLEHSAALGVSKARQRAPRRKGDLRRSIQARVETRGRTLEASLAMPERYAPVEFGGTVQPKRGQFLAVPIKPATALLPGPRSDVGNMFVLTSRDGRRFLASKAGGGVDLRWRLMRSVTIPGQGFMQKAHADTATDFEGRVLDDLEKAVL